MKPIKIHNPPGCPVCGSTDGCKLSGGLLSDAPLTVDDWRRVYEFIKYVELPFLHSIISVAVSRKRQKEKLND